MAINLPGAVALPMSFVSVSTPALEPSASTVPQTADVAAAPSHKHKRGTHIPALDGIRGLAILLVLIFHFSDVAYARGATGLSAILQRICGAGWIGVDLFFVLSGFLITSILCEAAGTKGYFKNFYMRRTLRIFPLYFGTLLVAFGIYPLIFGYKPDYQHIYNDKWYLVFYLQNFISIDWKSFSHFWSLAVEEHFYLVWPSVLFFFGRKGAIAACVLMIVGAIGIRVYHVMSMPDSLTEGQAFMWRQIPYLWTICRMDSLAIGSLLALLVNGVAADLVRFARAAPWVLLTAALACAAMLLKHGSFSYQHRTIQMVGYTVVAIGAAALLVMTVTSPPDRFLGRTFSANWLRFLGKYSYGIYVIHSFVHHWMKEHWSLAQIRPMVFNSQAAALAVYFAVATGISIGLALLSWHLYEKHFLKLKRFFEYRAPTLEGFRPNESVSKAGKVDPETIPVKA